MNPEINEKLKTLPESSGVYIMHNALGEIIYVGKAKNLKNRVRSYFKSYNHPPKVASMIDNVEYFEYILTDSELEALILENNLIKENMPKYNILLKDDKTYPFMKITVNEDFPRVLLTRRINNDGALYFGPYQSSYDLKQLINLIREIFCLRNCTKEFTADFEVSRPCLYYQLGKCKGVCARKITKEEYREIIEKVIEFVNGKTAYICQQINEEMKQAANDFDFEKAAVCRDRLKAIEVLSEKQKIVNSKGNDFDALAIFNKNNIACIQIFFVRNGKIIGREHYFIQDSEGMADSVIISEFIRCYYDDCTFIPGTVYVETELEDADVIEEWISSKASRSVKIKVPKIGDTAKLMRMIKSNAKKEHSEKELKTLRDITFKNSALAELTELLGLKSAPMHMEAYDISNMGDNSSVGSMVAYINGKPCTKKYRNFRIKNVSGQDDYASMCEVFTRRIQHGLKEKEQIKRLELTLETASFYPFPDVFFVDGGEGHRKAVLTVLERYGIDVPLFGIVKDDNHRTRGLISETGEIYIDPKSDAFMLITNIQDEMHRRAIEYLRRNQNKKVYGSELDEIPGVGEKRKKLLLSAFKSVNKIKNASVDELSSVKGIDKATAKSVFEYFNSEK